MVVVVVAVMDDYDVNAVGDDDDDVYVVKVVCLLVCIKYLRECSICVRYINKK